VSPTTATRSFSLPLPEDGANIAWWLRLKGVRDIVSGLAVLVFMSWGVPLGVGIILLIEAIIPVDDMLVILAAKGYQKCLRHSRPHGGAYGLRSHPHDDWCVKVVESARIADGIELKRGLPCVLLRELLTATALVDANQLVFADIDMGSGSKA
jgi:hypothetical protein